MDKITNRFLDAYLWLLEAKEGIWYEVKPDQEKILREIAETSNSPIMPELHFKEGKIKIVRYESISGM